VSGSASDHHPTAPLGIAAQADPSLSRTLARVRAVHGRLKRGDVLLADSDYSSFDEVMTLRQMGIDVVMRQTGGRRSEFRRGTRLGHEDHLVAWHRSRNRPEWTERSHRDYPSQAESSPRSIG
jgi:hypothetical protein